MPADESSTPAGSRDVAPATHLRWIGGVDGHLEMSPDLPPQATPRMFNSVQHVRDALQDPALVSPPHLAALAAFGLFFAAREVPATSQAAVLVDTLRTAAASLAQARPGIPAIQTALSTLLDTATQHRGIGVRQLHIRLLNEAAALLPQ